MRYDGRALGVIRVVLDNKLRLRLLRLSVRQAFDCLTPGIPTASLGGWGELALQIRDVQRKALYARFEGDEILAQRAYEELRAYAATGTSTDDAQRTEYADSVIGRVEQSAWPAAKELLAFFADRLKIQLREQGARHDLVDAVFALEGQDDLLLIVRRVEALGKFLETEDGKNLLAGYKRATNIIRIEEKKIRGTIPARRTHPFTNRMRKRRWRARSIPPRLRRPVPSKKRILPPP